jgi:hypothetical protein
VRAFLGALAAIFAGVVVWLLLAAWIAPMPPDPGTDLIRLRPPEPTPTSVPIAGFAPTTPGPPMFVKPHYEQGEQFLSLTPGGGCPSLSARDPVCHFQVVIKNYWAFPAKTLRLVAAPAHRIEGGFDDYQHDRLDLAVDGHWQAVSATTPFPLPLAADERRVLHFRLTVTAPRRAFHDGRIEGDLLMKLNIPIEDPQPQTYIFFQYNNNTNSCIGNEAIDEEVC